MPEFVETAIAGVVLIKPKVFGDDRGFFMESFNARDFRDAGLPHKFVQDNHSRSSYGVLRGLHYQYPTWQGKLVRCTVGSIFDVAVDIRRDSPTFGQWVAEELSADNHHQLYIPPGFAHGFCATSETADLQYKCTNLYVAAEDCCISWNDPDVGIQWPISNPSLSEKDQKGQALADVNIVG